MNSIDEEINNLSAEELTRFLEVYNSSVGDELWCLQNGITYGNPERDKAREAVFLEKRYKN